MRVEATDDFKLAGMTKEVATRLQSEKGKLR